MSSVLPKEYLVAADLNMIARVLDHAGYHHPRNEIDANDRHHASRFLLEMVWRGVGVEKDLMAALEARDILAKRERIPPPQDRLEAFSERAYVIGRLTGARRSIH